MDTWYSCKIKHAKENEEGFLKEVTDAFLLDAVSYTDAEARIYEIAEREIHREFVVTNITKTNISEVINYEDAFNWYKCKVTYEAASEDGGKPLKVNIYFAVCADNVKQAYERIEENLASMLVPFEIPSITLTKIADVFASVADEVPQVEESENEEVE